MSAPSNPFGSTSHPGDLARRSPSRPGDTADGATAGTDGSASWLGPADISEIQTGLLPERQWDKSDILTDKLPPRPRDIAEQETGRLPDRSDAVSWPPMPAPVAAPPPVSAPTPAAMPAPASLRVSVPTRPVVEISELPTGKLTVPPRPRDDRRDRDDPRAWERERKRAELRERGRARTRAERREREEDSRPLPAAGRRPRRAWWLAGVAVALVLLALSASGLVAFSATRGPAAVVQAYCGDLLAKDYASAYDLFSPHARARLTEDQFQRAGVVRERLDGVATGCAITDGLPLVGSAGALNPFAGAATITATLRRRRAQTGTVTLVRQDGGSWTIDALDPALEGADVAPLSLADAFCAGLVAGDFHSAYGLFSNVARHRVSEAEFTQAVKDALSDGGNAKVTSCAPDPATYSVKGTTASVTAELDTSAGGVPLTLPTTLTFVKDHGAWVIDNFDVTP